MRVFLLSVFLWMMAVPCFADPSASVPIINFAEVAPGIYRGSDPTRYLPGFEDHDSNWGMELLSSLGIKTILNLRDTPADIFREIQKAETFGMSEISIRIDLILKSLGGPSFETVVQIMNVLEDPGNKPLFVHCWFGEDRTGFAIGLYRVLIENWDYDRAYAEMKKYGFKSILFHQYANKLEEFRDPKVQKRLWSALFIEKAKRLGNFVNQSPSAQLGFIVDIESAMKRLIERGADVNAQDPNGWTSLLYAAHYNLGNVANDLLKQDADPNVSSVGGVTPLMLAAAHGNIELAHQLLKYGARSQVRSVKKKWTAFGFAKSNGFAKEFQFLNEIR